MSPYQWRPTMLLLVVTFLVSMFMSNYSVQGYYHPSARRSHYTDMKRFRQLIRQLQRDDDADAYRQLSFYRRAEAEGDCTGDIVEGHQWAGEQVSGMAGIDTVQRCMDNCDMNDKCMGWSYKPESAECWGLADIKGIIKVDGVKSGSCVGTNMKTKCTENRVGQYAGAYVQVSQSVASVQQCMSACDESSTCFGWLYFPNGEQCFLSPIVGPFNPSDTHLATGSCIAPQKRNRLADSLKIFRQESLERHNEKRKEHCVPALTLDDNLNKAAQDFADQLAAADIIPPDYDTSSMQTVYFNKGDNAEHGSVIVDNFYDEHKYYKYDNPDFGFTNHFPKIIWKSTKKMGVGRAFTSDKGSMFIVTKYDWTGDMTESYQENVQKKCT